MAAASDAKQTKPPKLTKAVIEDTILPDEDLNFNWPKSTYADCWRLFLNGSTGNIFKPSDINKWVLSVDSADSILGSVISYGKGIELLNTIERVHDRGLTVIKNSLIFGIAYCTCSKDQVVKTRAYEVMQKICASSSSFLLFIDYREQISKCLRSTTGWSKAHRNAVKKWYQGRPAMEIACIIMEHPRQNKWSHRDVLRLAHVAPSNGSEKILFSFIIADLKKTVELFKDESEERIDDCQKLLQYLEKLTAVRKAQSTSQLIPLMVELKLPWDFVSPHLRREADLWEEMVAAVPFDVMIQNTTRMAKLKLLEGNTRTKETYRSRCADKNEVSSSGIHPFKILAERDCYRNAMNDHKRKPTWKIDADVLASINSAMSTAIDTNLKSSGKRYFIAIDASASMKSHIANMDDVQCRVVAAFMSMCIAKAEKKVVVKAFSLDFVDVNIDDNTTVDDIVKNLENTLMGGSDCARPMIYAKNQKIKVDTFVVFSDKETWRGKTTPHEALKQYRRTMKIPAKLIVVALNPSILTLSRDVTMPDDRGIMEICGFSVAMAKVMHNFALYPY